MRSASGMRPGSRRAAGRRARLSRIATAFRTPFAFRSDLETRQRLITRRRVTVMLVVVWLALAGLALRLTQLQAFDGRRLHRMAQRQQLESIALEPRRGRILDRRGRALAINVESTSIYAVPSLIRDRRAFAARIAPVVGQDRAEIERRLAAGRYFAWVARKVTPEVVDRVNALNLGDAVGFLTEAQRAYPNGTLASQVLGFAGIDNQGLAGVELSYDRVLRGTAGKVVASRDGLGRIKVETQRVLGSPEDGREIILTIDQVIQYIAERELESAVARTGARRGWVMVMDPVTGEVLAAATAPGFDPNRGPAADPQRWLNRAVSEASEPGSTFKIFLMAAALDSGAVTPGELFYCPGSLEVPGGHVIRDAHPRGHGWQTLSGIVKNSCNVGSAQVATKLGKSRFYHYIRAFGFGRPTGVDLPGEAGGIVPVPSAWLGPALQTISFGQGVSTTAIQMLTAVTALANDGTMVKPFAVRAVRDRQGRTVAVTGRTPVGQVIKAGTAEAVLAMLVRATAEGTGTLARIAGYAVAGKTATAQKPGRTGGYDPDRYIASFLGLVPVPHPRLAALVVLDEPRGAYYGGEIAAPVFREIAAQALWYLRVPPQAEGTAARR